MRQPAAMVPVLTYLFHRLEDRFAGEGTDGRPTLLVLDEAWVFLADGIFATKINEWLKVLRKRNVAVVFATQSLADVQASAIAPALIENCPTRLFLPNPRALEPNVRIVYEAFGLNEQQLRLLSAATPKREYYYQSREGNRLFELSLGLLALALCGSSAHADRALADRLLRDHPREAFAEQFLRHKGWADAAQSLASP